MQCIVLQFVKKMLSAGGAVYVYNNVTGISSWTETMILVGADTASGDVFGFSVALSGNILVAGAPGHDSSRGLLVWCDFSSVSISHSYAYITHLGAVYVFVSTNKGTHWSQTGKLMRSGTFNS